MRVTNLNLSESLITQMNGLVSKQMDLQNQVSTGLRITKPEDDPAAMARLVNLGTESRQLKQYQTNSSTAQTIAQMTYTNLKSFNDIYTRAGELATLGGDSAGSSANSAYATELNQLIEQAVQMGNSRLGNDYLFAGTAVDTAPYTVTRDPSTGQISTVAYGGNSDQRAISISETSSVTPGASGETNTGLNAFINQLVALRDALAGGDSAALTSARASLEDSGDVITSAISENGAIQLRIEMVQTQQTSRAANIEKLATDESGVDMAAAIVRLNSITTSYEAALASSSKIMQMSLLDYVT